MRILHIIGTLDPRSGGPAAAIATLIGSCADDLENEVVTLDAPSAPFLAKLEFPVTGLGPARAKYGLSSRLSPWLRANCDRFDGVVVHGLWQFCGFAVWRVLGGRKPYMVFTHGMLDPYFKRAFPFKHLKKWAYWLLIEYWVLRGAERVLFTCKEEERLARQTFWLHHWTPHIVPLGASPPKADHATLRQAFLSRFAVLAGRRYLLFLGRIDRKKGCDLLIATFIRAATLDPALALDLVMAGPDPNNWRAELLPAIASANLTSRVHWTGMLEGNEKWGAFLCSDAFILPSHQENFGIAVSEALACGKPVLLSDKVNIASQIVAAGAGLVDSDTEQGTLRLISAWIAMPPEPRRLMCVAARQTFEQTYDIRKHARDLAALFENAEGLEVPQLTEPASAVE